MATQIGTDLSIGCGTITGSYLVRSRTDGQKNVVMEDIEDQDGALYTRIVFRSEARPALELVCLTGALPETDFAEGAIATHADFTDHWVDSAPINRSKSAKTVSLQLHNLGIT